MMTEMERPSQPAPAVVKAKVLLLEDDDMLAGLLARVLRTDGYVVEVLDCADDLPTGAKLAAFDIVLSDIHLAKNTSGHDVLNRVREAAPKMPVILMTAYADIEGAMSAVSRGAYDYLPKPIEPTELKRMVGEAIARRVLAAQVQAPSDPREIAAGETKIVGAAPAMIDLYKTVAHVAPTTATVLIIGESGTGKELVARQIHTTSPRVNKPFVAVNCAALPESLLESELFGHERGAFTGAVGLKRGVFEEATGGTLFLDEMGDITPKMQVQLLRVLQEGEIRRVGSSETVKVDVRVVAATNRDLKTDVASGRFREDLYFRLQVVTVRVPPLRGVLVPRQRARDEPPRRARDAARARGRDHRGGSAQRDDADLDPCDREQRAGLAERRLAHARGARAPLHRPSALPNRREQDASGRAARHRSTHAEPHVRARARRRSDRPR